MTTIRPRSSWGAEPPRRRSPVKSVNYFVVHYDGGGDLDPAKSPQILRNFQTYHMSKGWSDIGYNFLVDQNGVIWEGRGWGIKGSHAGASANPHSVGVQAMIGASQRPSEALKGSLRWLYAETRRRYGNVSPSCHSAWMSTSCPGEHLRSWIRAGGLTTQTPPEKDWSDMATKDEIRAVVREEVNRARDELSDYLLREMPDKVLLQPVKTDKTYPTLSEHTTLATKIAYLASNFREQHGLLLQIRDRLADKIGDAE